MCNIPDNSRDVILPLLKASIRPTSIYLRLLTYKLFPPEIHHSLGKELKVNFNVAVLGSKSFIRPFEKIFLFFSKKIIFWTETIRTGFCRRHRSAIPDRWTEKKKIHFKLVVTHSDREAVKDECSLMEAI